jgi:pimeloyl-ACP methyl ester carboxylesterase
MTNKKDHPFKNHKMPLPMRVFFSSTTLLFKVLGVVSPTLAGKLALRLFMTPTRFRTPRKEKALRETAELKFICVRERKISVRSWGKAGSPVVLLSHGWGGRCTQFHAFIPPLVDAGYRVVGFDVPGHGDSEGKRTNMMDVASVISEIAKQEGPFEAILGHLFGTGTALLAIDKYKVKTKKVALIGCFHDVIWITNLFGEVFDLSESTLEAMRQVALKKFKNTYGISWTWKDVSPLQTIKSFKGEIFLIHDEEDHEVPYEFGKLLQDATPHAQTMTTSGFGHRKILMNKKVVEAVLTFIQKQ